MHRILTLCLAIMLLANVRVHAETYAWIGGEAGNWSDPLNWFPFGVPSFTDTATLDLNTVSGGGTGITLLAVRTIGHLEVSGSCPQPFRIGGGIFTGLAIEHGDFLARPGMDLTALKLQFRAGNCRLRSAGNAFQTVGATGGAIVSLQDDLVSQESLEFISARLRLMGKDLTTPRALLTPAFGGDTVLTDANGSTIRMIDGAFGGPSLTLSGWFNLDGATVHTGIFEFAGVGSLGNAEINCERFYTSFSLSAAALEPGTATVFLRFRDGGTDPNTERVEVRDGVLHRVVLVADTFDAIGIMGDTIRELVFSPGVSVPRIRVRDWIFGSGALHVETLQVAGGTRIEAPSVFDVALTLGAADVCTDGVTFRNFAVSGSGSYRAGSASTDLGGNTGWSFTDCAPPVSCSVAPSGLSASVGPTGVALSWAALPDALAYRVRGRPLGTSVWRFLPGIAATPAAFVPGGALTAGTYEWQAVAACSPDYSVRSPFSATATFAWPAPRLDAGPPASGTVDAWRWTLRGPDVVVEGLEPERPFQIVDALGRVRHVARADGAGAAIAPAGEWPAGVYWIVQGGRSRAMARPR